jgi:hypothetical protein
MHIAVSTICRDESDVIGTFLEYHLAIGVSRILVTDTGSTDGTLDIVRDRKWSGAVVTRTAEGFHQASVATTSARSLALEAVADWVIHIDADEFLWPTNGALAGTLASIPQDVAVLEVPRRNFRPSPAVHGGFVHRMVVRERDGRNESGGRLKPKVAHRPSTSIAIGHGGHSLSGAEGRTSPATGLEILHYPTRSLPQLRRKVQRIRMLSEGGFIGTAAGAVWRDLVRLDDRGELEAWYNQRAIAADQPVNASEFIVDARLSEFVGQLGS